MRVDRYSRTAIVLHWLTAAVLVVQYTLGWAMQAIHKQPAGPRADAFNLHKSIGLTILALMLFRLLWRWRNPPPALPPMPRWQRQLALRTHHALYAMLLLLPIVGYLGSVFSGHPVKYFGLPLPSPFAADADLKHWMSVGHLALGWLVAAAVVLHTAGAIRHWLIERDGLVARMGLGPRHQ